MKLRFKNGTFYDVDGTPYYIEYIKSPFRLISKTLDGKFYKDIYFNVDEVEHFIENGTWVEFSLNLYPPTHDEYIQPTVNAKNRSDTSLRVRAMSVLYNK